MKRELERGGDFKEDSPFKHAALLPSSSPSKPRRANSAARSGSRQREAPLLELTPELASAFYDDGGAAGAEPQRDQFAGTAPDPIGAPDGSTWDPQYHPEHNEYYYVNSRSGETSWEPPAAAGAPRDQYASTAPAPIGAPDGLWEPQYDEETGDYFYVNSATGEASWEPQHS